MKLMNVYLSGGMEYADGDGFHWRNELQQWIESTLRHAVFNPTMESNKFFAERYPNMDIRRLKFENIEQYTDIIRYLIDIDCKEIAHRSDYVICFWDESAARGAGTKGELTMAKFFGKPVYLVTSFPLQDIPGWVLGCATKTFNSFDEMKQHLISLNK